MTRPPLSAQRVSRNPAGAPVRPVMVVVTAVTAANVLHAAAHVAQDIPPVA